MIRVPLQFPLIWSRYFPFLSHKCDEICEKSALLVSAPLPFRALAFAHSPSLAPPALPPRAAFHLLWATPCVKAGIRVMYESIWSPFFFYFFAHAPPCSSGRRAVSRTSSWGSRGGYLLFEAICLGMKRHKTPQSGGVERQGGWWEVKEGKSEVERQRFIVIIIIFIIAFYLFFPWLFTRNCLLVQDTADWLN